MKGFSVCISQAADAVRGGMVDKIKDMLAVIAAEQESAETDA